MNDTDKLIVATALRKMFAGGYLDICTINQCIDLLGLIRQSGGKSYDRLRTLHCVHFKDMPAEIAQQVTVWIGDCMNGQSIDALVAAAMPAKDRNGSHMLRHLQ